MTGTLAAIAVSIVYMLAWLTSPGFNLLKGPLFWFVVLVFASTIWAENPGLTVKGVGATAIAAFAGFRVGSVLKVEDVLRVIEKTVGFIALLSLFLYFLAPSYALDQGSVNYGTLIGIYAQKNGLAFVLVIGVITTLFQENKTTAEVVQRFLLLCLFSIDLWLAQSSAGIAIATISVFLRLFAFQWLRKPTATRQILAIGVMIGLPIAMIMAFQSLSWILEFFGKDPTISSRTVRWMVLIDAWKDRPWLGYGWGAFATDPTIADSQHYLYKHVATNTQNGYLQVLAELGVVGSVLFVLAILSVVKPAVHSLMSATRVTDIWPAVMLLAVLINNGFEQGTRGAQLVMFSLVAALVLRRRRVNVEN